MHVVGWLYKLIVNFIDLAYQSLKGINRHKKELMAPTHYAMHAKFSEKLWIYFLSFLLAKDMFF